MSEDRLEEVLFNLATFGWDVDCYDEVSSVVEFPELLVLADHYWWDNTAADLGYRTLDGEPVPLWWAFAGAHEIQR